MKTWVKIAIAAGVILALGGAGAAVIRPELSERAEAGYQAGADAKRISDVHRTAELVEFYIAVTGRAPFEEIAASSPAGAVTVILASPNAEKQMRGRGNPLGAEEPSITAPQLAAELSKQLGRRVGVPVDPQRVENGAPTAYYLRVKPDGEYLIAAFLRAPRANTVQLAPHVWAYGLRSAEGEWPGSNIQHGARRLSDISPAEREAIRAAGESAAKRFPGADLMDRSG